MQSAVANKLDEWFDTGLKDWDVSRDAPYFGFEIPDAPGKYFYVWLDAPVGYMASFENLCKRRGLAFDDYWKADSTAELHHFIGKDILYFHSLFWPATLEGAGFRKPTAVHAHGFLTVNGEKMSKSRGTFVTARRYLDVLPPDYFRYFLAAKLGPGLDDIDMNLGEFATRINADLVGKLVNIASRCASFIQRGYGGRLAAELPDPALYREFVDAGAGILEAWESLEYAAAVREIMALADRANLYIDRNKPWLAAKDPARAAEVQAVCTQGINLFRVLMAYLKPVLPATAERAETFLGAPIANWHDIARPLLGTTINEYQPLATRVDATTVGKLLETPMTETTPNAAPAAGPATISAEEFARIDLRVARIEAAEYVEGADRLLRLTVDLGGERRTVFAGIRGAYEPEKLAGRHVVIVANLKPKKLRFGVSEGHGARRFGRGGPLPPGAGCRRDRRHEGQLTGCDDCRCRDRARGPHRCAAAADAMPPLRLRRLPALCGGARTRRDPASIAVRPAASALIEKLALLLDRPDSPARSGLRRRDGAARCLDRRARLHRLRALPRRSARQMRSSARASACTRSSRRIARAAGSACPLARWTVSA